ncbi:30S ribosomal protein S9 [Candidatus Woesearchaeota archaeon]|nr:30S ribosomal protein S9 [Candidatus Woesearchaeota archaeon]
MVTKRMITCSGKRKKALARATLREGKGRVTINHHALAYYEPQLGRLRITEPLLLAGDLAHNVDVMITVRGGGWASQAEACRLVIAKCLVAYTKDEELKNKFLEYDRHLLVADVRMNEPCKPNRHSKPRAKVQKSYR